METVAAMVRVRGPDPKLVKASGTAFHQADHGITVTSASGSTAKVTLHTTLFSDMILMAFIVYRVGAFDQYH